MELHEVPFILNLIKQPSPFSLTSTPRRGMRLAGSNVVWEQKSLIHFFKSVGPSSANLVSTTGMVSVSTMLRPPRLRSRMILLALMSWGMERRTWMHPIPIIRNPSHPETRPRLKKKLTISKYVLKLYWNPMNMIFWKTEVFILWCIVKPCPRTTMLSRVMIVSLFAHPRLSIILISLGQFGDTLVSRVYWSLWFAYWFILWHLHSFRI